MSLTYDESTAVGLFDALLTVDVPARDIQVGDLVRVNDWRVVRVHCIENLREGHGDAVWLYDRLGDCNGPLRADRVVSRVPRAWLRPLDRSV